jgi:hypothetical protein
MTAAERARYERARARYLARRKKAQEDEEIIDEEPIVEDEEEMTEEARRAMRRAYARYLRTKKAQEVVEKDDEKAVEKEDEPAEPKEDEEELEAKRCAARRRARMMAQRRAYMRRKKAQEVSDDLKDIDGDSSNIEQLHNGDSPSDDLVDPDVQDGGVEQIPPASVDEAEEKILNAYALIDAQIAKNIVPATAKKATLASQYCKRYTSREMKFAAQQLNKVGSAGKSAGNVRVSRRSTMPTKSIVAKTGFEDQCLFA